MELVEAEVDGLVAGRVLVPPHWTRDVHTHALPRSQLCHSPAAATMAPIDTSDIHTGVGYGVCSNTLRLERLGTPRDLIYLTEAFLPRAQDTGRCARKEEDAVAAKMERDLHAALAASSQHDGACLRVMLVRVTEVTRADVLDYKGQVSSAVCPAACHILPSHRIFLQLVMDLSTVTRDDAEAMADEMLRHARTQYITPRQVHTTACASHSGSVQPEHHIDEQRGVMTVGLWLPRAVCVLHIALHGTGTVSAAEDGHVAHGYSSYDLRWNALQGAAQPSSRPLVHAVRDELGFELADTAFSLPSIQEATPASATPGGSTRQTFVLATMPLAQLLPRSWYCYPVVEYVFEAYIQQTAQNNEDAAQRTSWQLCKLRSSTRHLKTRAAELASAQSSGEAAARCREDCTARSTVYVLRRHTKNISHASDVPAAAEDDGACETDMVLLVRVFAPRMLSDRAVLVFTDITHTVIQSTSTTVQDAETMNEAHAIETAAALMERLFAVSLPLRQQWGALVTSLAAPHTAPSTTTSNSSSCCDAAATWFREGNLVLGLPTEDRRYAAAVVVPLASRSGAVRGAMKVYTTHTNGAPSATRDQAEDIFVQQAAVWQLLATGRSVAEQVDYIVTEYAAVHRDRLSVLEQRVQANKKASASRAVSANRATSCATLWLRIVRPASSAEAEAAGALYVYTRVQAEGMGRLLIASASFTLDAAAELSDETVAQEARRELAQWVEGIEASAL